MAKKDSEAGAPPQTPDDSDRSDFESWLRQIGTVREHSPEMLALAQRVVDQQLARTTPTKGGACPCGRGPGTHEGGGMFPNGRFHCDACEKDYHDAALRFLMDDSFGGP